MSWYSWAYVVIGIAFCAVEGIAIFNKRADDTFSEHVWKFIKGKPARRIMLAGFLIWLTLHFLLFGSLG